MTAPGSSADGGKTITFEGTNANPMSGEKDAWFRQVMHIVSDQENVFEMYAKDESGREFKTMEITATRARVSDPDAPPSLFVMSSSSHREVWARWVRSAGNRWGRNHTSKAYAEMLDLHAKPGDTFVMVFAADREERIPSGYEDLLPLPWEEIQARLAEGETVKAAGSARGLHVLILAAPRQSMLPELINDTDLPTE